LFCVCSSFSDEKRIYTHALLGEHDFLSWVPFTGAEVASL
jgi:hypothetical protein